MPKVPDRRCCMRSYTRWMLHYKTLSNQGVIFREVLFVREKDLLGPAEPLFDDRAGSLRFYGYPSISFVEQYHRLFA